MYVFLVMYQTTRLQWYNIKKPSWHFSLLTDQLLHKIKKSQLRQCEAHLYHVFNATVLFKVEFLWKNQIRHNLLIKAEYFYMSKTCLEGIFKLNSIIYCYTMTTITLKSVLLYIGTVLYHYHYFTIILLVLWPTNCAIKITICKGGRPLIVLSSKETSYLTFYHEQITHNHRKYAFTKENTLFI